MAVIVQPLDFLYKIKIGEVSIYCKQLSYRMRSTIGMRFHKQNSGAETQDMIGLLFEVLKHSIKDVEGFVNPDGSPFKLDFENGAVTDDCLDKLFYVENVGDVLQICASNFINMRMPDKIIGINGEVIEGVTVEKIKQVKKK